MEHGMPAFKPQDGAAGRCRGRPTSETITRRHLRHRRRLRAGLRSQRPRPPSAASVVLIENHKMGGDCLNYGCVPSKALLAAAKRAHAMRTAGAFGIAGVEPEIDHRAVNAACEERDRRDRAERFASSVSPASACASSGAPARFIDKKTVVAGEYRIRARRFVIATGSSPLVPPIPGLDSVPYFTNETIFDNQERPHT